MNENPTTPKGDAIEVGPRIDEDRPIPPRYGWLKRLSITASLLVFLLACLRLWWGWEANRRLQAEIDSCHAAGQPVYAADFERELAAVPDDQNAALLLGQAAQALMLTSDEVQWLDDVSADPQRALEDATAVEGIIRTNRPALELVRQARSRPQVAWSWPVASPTFFGNLGAQRRLGKLLCLAATHAHHRGDDAEVLELIMDMRAHARSVSAHPGLIHILVGMAIDGLVVNLIEEFGATLNLDRARGQDDSAPVRHATEAQVRRLIELLLDEELARHSAVIACYAERAYVLNLTNMLAGSSRNWPFPSGSMIDAFTGPILTLDTLRAVRFQTVLAQAVQQASWPAASTVFLVHLPADSLLQVVTRPLTGTLSSSYERWVELLYRHLALRRMGAIALAIRLYEVDHGHRPRKLAQLAPPYLPAVPADPFAADGSEIRYLPDVEHAILYSISVDGQDDGGIGPRKPDVVFYLDGEPRKRKQQEASPSIEAGEDDENTEDNQGEGQ